MVSDPWGGVKGGIAVYELYRLCHREGNTNMLLSSLVWLGQRIEYHFAGNWPELDDDFCTCFWKTANLNSLQLKAYRPELFLKNSTSRIWREFALCRGKQNSTGINSVVVRLRLLGSQWQIHTQTFLKYFLWFCDNQ